MFNNIPVEIFFSCNNTTFASFEDLTSKDGVRHILQDGFRHYLICSAPRIIYDSFNAVNEEVTIKKQNDIFSFTEMTVKIQINLDYYGKKVKIEKIDCVNYPEIEVTLDNGDKLPPFRTCFEFLTMFIIPSVTNPLLHNVLYVGQTQPHNKYLRLKGHETFAKIADHFLKSKPQCELFIKMLKFDEPKYKSADETQEVTPQWRNNVSNTVGGINPDQVTSVIEAALIRMLQPEYNNHYKNSFPSQEHCKYNDFYNLPIDSIMVGVNENLRGYDLYIYGNRVKEISIQAPLTKK